MHLPTHGPPAVAFVQRQSPDWAALSSDFRAGMSIDPARFVPDHDIHGFPPRVDLLIDQWNKRFSLDFFSFRFLIAKLSRRSIRAVPDSWSFTFDELPKVAHLAAQSAVFIYFHDDDDFFAPSLASIVRRAGSAPDSIVTPLFRVGSPTFTFIRDQYESDIVWGNRGRPGFRFQTNNYGINGRHCQTVSALTALKDHVAASQYATGHQFFDQVLTAPISATVKTPGSASMLPGVFETPDSATAKFREFIQSVLISSPPPHCEWITAPVQQIIRLVESIEGGDRAAMLADRSFD